LKEITAIDFFVGDASSGRPFGELMVDELRLGTGYRSVIPRIPNPLDSDKDDLEDTVESNTGVFVSEADPDIGGFTLDLDLWVSNELSTWSLLPLTEEDVRGTERGVEVSLPLPTDETFYRFEFDRP